MHWDGCCSQCSLAESKRSSPNPIDCYHCPHWHHLSLSPTSQQVPLPSDRAPDLNLLTFAIIGMV